MEFKNKYIFLFLVLIALSILSYDINGYKKLLLISWFSLLTMIFPLLVLKFSKSREDITKTTSGKVWSYGLSSGAMIVSSFIFIVPLALKDQVIIGSIGVAIGLIMTFSYHTLLHIVFHKRKILGKEKLLDITSHTIIAGTSLGVIYSQAPSISLILGISIVSHKLPASFSVISSIERKEMITIPATIFGIFCLFSFLFMPDNLPTKLVNLMFGISAGIFIHLAIDFLPDCEQGELYDVIEESDNEHEVKDKIRKHSVISVIIGGVIIIGLFYIVEYLI